MSKKYIFHKIDEVVFAKIDTLKSSPFYSKYTETIDQLKDTHQRYVNTAISYSLILLPVIITSFILYGNISTRIQLAQKQSILDEIELFNAKNMLISDMERKLTTAMPINTKNSLLNRLNNLSSRSSISQEYISVQDFQTVRSVGSIKEYSAQVAFKSLSTKQLSSFLAFLIKEKINISLLDIKKTEDISSLEGNISLIIFGKNE